MGWLSNIFSSNSESNSKPEKSQIVSSQATEIEEDAAILKSINGLMIDIDKKFESEEDFEFDPDDYDSREEAYESYKAEKKEMKVDAKFEVIKDYIPKLRSKTIARIIGTSIESVNWDLKAKGLNSIDFIGEETEEEKKRSEVREKFERLKPNLVNMTLAQIASEIGDTERFVIYKIGREKLYCLDWDGSDPEIKKRYGSLQPRIVCPHCNTKECVRKKDGKGEVVLNSRNLYRQKDVLEMHCDNCRMDWII